MSYFLGVIRPLVLLVVTLPLLAEAAKVVRAGVAGSIFHRSGLIASAGFSALFSGSACECMCECSFQRRSRVELFCVSKLFRSAQVW